MVFQKVEYKLIDNYTGSFLWLNTKENPKAPAPKNWDEADRTLKRSEKTYGVYTELSKNLVFTKQAASFLRNSYLLRDIEADVTLEEWRFNPNTEVPYLYSTGVFDFSQYESTKLEVKIPFKSGGLNALIQSQIKEKFELERTEAINGNEISELSTVDVALTSRDILLISKLEGTEDITNTFSNSTPFRAPLLEVTSQSDEENIGYVIGDDFVSYNNSPSLGNPFTLLLGAAQHFYIGSDVDKTVTINVEMKVRNVEYYGSSNLIQVYLVKTNAAYSATEITVLYNSGFVTSPEHIISYTGDFDILETENLALVINSQITPIGSSSSFHRIRYDAKPVITVTENSQREDSQSKAVLYHEAGDKLMQIITGEQNRFYSSFYGREDIGYTQTGEYALTGTALGLWIRQFNDEKIEMSLNDYIENSNVIHNTGYTIETINNTEKLVVEDMKYFFQDAVAIRLPNQVNKLERKAADEFCNSSLLFGYKEGGDYEEAMGLDEYNVRNGYSTNLTRVDTKYEKQSPFRADKYAQEFARRKPKLNFPEQDTRYDKDIHLLDLKTGDGLAYEERVWQDDFETEPLNVYSPQTATNLRLTPANIKERHEWFFGNALYKFPDEKIRFSNSAGNSELITKKAGETALAENGDTLISDLEKPRFVSQWITFEHEVNYEINEQIYGKTTVNNRDIPNYFFKVEFINEYNKKEYGYLFEVQPNKQGKWKLLKAL